MDNAGYRPSNFSKKMQNTLPVKQLLKPRAVNPAVLPLSIRSDLNSRESNLRIEDSLDNVSMTTP